MSHTAESILGRPLIDALNRHGFAVVPIEPTDDMQRRAANGSIGTFSAWHLRALWFSLLALADEKVIPHLPTAEDEKENLRAYIAGARKHWGIKHGLKLP